jgi:replicative DNA helicase
MSNLETLDPAFAISAGNQLDLTVPDLLAALALRDDIDAIGVYVEGFADLDGLTNGLHGGQLIVVAARPAMGKSTLGLDWCRAASMRS